MYMPVGTGEAGDANASPTVGKNTVIIIVVPSQLLEEEGTKRKLTISTYGPEYVYINYKYQIKLKRLSRRHRFNEIIYT